MPDSLLSANVHAWILFGLLGLLTLALLATAVAARLAELRRRRSVAALQVAHDELDRRAQQDGLTALSSRVEFEDRLGAAVQRADRERRPLAVLFVNLDGFKPVNESFGHLLGDGVLREVGVRLQALASDALAVARVGGDEFLLLVDGGREAAAAIARGALDRLSRPYTVGERTVELTCSIGIVLYPELGTHGQLLARADAAMVAAKRSGGATYAVYEQRMEADVREQVELLQDLRRAIDDGRLELYYQPKIDALSGQVTAAEALLRWHHPERGLISPAVFIPIAERFGLVGALGNWVIEDACRQARAWRDQGLRMRVAINLSAYQMRQDGLVERLQSTLERYQIHPSLLTCEITESVAMEDTRVTQQTFAELGEAGIHLSIDDFGTGYSSLSYLRRLPAAELKIDRSFVMDLEASADARAIVEAVLRMAHALGLKVVAEGVETEGQRDLLVALGCNELQGFLFARPMSARALALWAMDDEPSGRELDFRPSLFQDTMPAVLD